ncbi:MAG: LptA/OstA family protein, partial [Terracidiphilus sp.]
IEISATTKGKGRGTPALKLVTSDLIFDRDTGNASTTAPVQFTFPGGSGSGVGVDYSTHDATVRVERAIVFQLAASEKTGGMPVSASGSSLEIHRNERTVVLNGPVSAIEGQRQLSAAKISVDFDEANRAKQVLAEGSPQIRATEGGNDVAVSASQFEGVLNPAGWIETVAADGNVHATRRTKAGTGNFSAGHVEFAMLPGRNLVRDMTATGGVSAQSRQGAESDALRTSALHVAFSNAKMSDGASGKAAPKEIAEEQITGAETLAPAVIEMAKDSETTTVSAKQFVAQAGTNGRIDKLFGHVGVAIRRESASGTPQTIAAPELVATLGSRGEWETAEATGGVRMQQAGREATANSARIDRATEAIDLEGSPTVIDGQSRTSATTMKFNQKTGALQA